MSSRSRSFLFSERQEAAAARGAGTVTPRPGGSTGSDMATGSTRLGGEPIPPRVCRTCGQTFTAVRKDQNYCRRWCREHKYLTRAEGELS